ncbi:ankyrin repeat domain-containing protein 49 isoform X2 [Hyla sarda]|uniref:ankyrin repeat domain-containing protein 49 isoform X2 n=1 Tax=Hyla sarda TaxID=327740 RepID=UPI0024C3F1EA|nr:ankyrin repeat domain-containing protein 49 isoform X2 [Hyla sarda]
MLCRKTQDRSSSDMTTLKDASSPQDNAADNTTEDEIELQEKLDYFPEDFNQLDLLETHRHLIPTGTQSLWPGESEDDEEEKSEDWYQTQEENLKDDPKELILFAAENNRLQTVQRILSMNPDLVNVADEDHYTPLHRASYNGHLAIVRKLIAKGANVHAVTLDGWTPLHSACKWNNTAVASFLLQHGANINAQTMGSLTPLHLAAANRDSRQLLELLLLNRYIRPQLTNKLGETAYEIARRTDIYHYLFEIADYWT